MKLALCFLLFKLGYAVSFLFDVSSSSPLGQTSITDKHFVTLVELLSEEKQMRHQLEQIVVQLQQEVVALNQHVTTSTGNASVTVSEFASLKNEINDLKDLRPSFSKLSSEHAALKLSFETQTRDVQMFQNLTTELQNEITRLKNLQSVNQAVALNNLQQNISALSSRTARLESLETARQQDFLAIYKQVTDSKNDIIDVQTTNSEFRKNSSDQFTKLENTTDKLTVLMTDTSATVKANSDHITNIYTSLNRLSNKTIATIQRQIEDNDRKVALTVCQTSISGRIVKFSNVRSSVGVTNLSSFKSSGKFTCEHSGLYHVSATLMSKAINDQFNIYKNGYWIAEAYTSEHSPTQGYHSSTVVGAVELDVGDTVHIDTGNDLASVNGAFACLTIIKVN